MCETDLDAIWLNSVPVVLCVCCSLNFFIF